MKRYRNIRTIICLLTAAVLCGTFAASACAEGELPESWFDDALFIGDSIVGSLGNEALINGGLGEAQILHINGLSCHGIVRDDTKIHYMGKTLTIGETALLSGANKLFLLLAMNDVGQPEKVIVESWDALFAQIRESCPDIQIFAMSGTPIYSERAFLTNANMLAYNEILKSECEKLGIVYVNITGELADGTGHLKEEFHTDDVHLTRSACKQWIKNLRDPENYSEDVSEERE